MKKLFSFLILFLALSQSLFAASTDLCYDTDTKLMAQFNGANTATATTDDAGNFTFTNNGNVQLSTTSPKFGTASSLHDGTGDFWTAGDNAALDVGTQPWTIDLWINFAATNINATIVDFGGGASSGIRLYYADSKNVQIILNNASVYTTGAGLGVSVGTWHHFAASRDGSGNVKFWLDGTQVGSTTSDSTNIAGGTSGVGIGAGFSDYAGLHLNGKIDAVRLVVGTAVWTSNFTAPSLEYTACASASTKNLNLLGVGQ